MLGIGQLLKNLIGSPKQAAAAGALFGLIEGLAPLPTGKGTLEGKPIPQGPQPYSGMQDMSGDPILPTKPQVQMGRPDPFAPVGYQPAPQPAAQPAPQPVAPSRKQVVNDAYDALRIQFNAGEITADQFAKEGMKIHKKYFDKK
jgi:hypothetical protein